jgi:hypothetical protein
VIIQSNVSAVLGRVTRLRDRDIPAAMARALRPEHWAGPFRDEAERTLLALAGADERQFIPGFIETLAVAAFPNGFTAKMRTPFDGAATLEEYQAARAALSPADLSGSLFLEKVQEFEDMVTRWVEEEKRKDRKDLGKTDEEIGHFISYLMLAPEGSLSPREQAARESLMPHIADYLQRKQADERLTADTTDLWLRAVLAAWCALARQRFPEVLRAELRGAKTELPI